MDLAAWRCDVDGCVFINYRGVDSRSYGALLYTDLIRRFGEDSVFLDGESIPAGGDYVEVLLARVRSARVVLAVIGPSWLTATDANGRRCVDNPGDWIRRELAEAFTAGVRVIPVLIDDAVLPAAADLPGNIAALSRCQARHVRRREPTRDLDRLAGELTVLYPELAAPERSSSGSEAPRRDVINRAVGGATATGRADTLIFQQMLGQGAEHDAGKAIPIVAQLPPAVSAFVGRESELDELRKQFVTQGVPGIPQTVTIDGAPGVGKTALALRFAHNIARNYEDGQLYSDLRGYCLEGVPRTSTEVLEDFLTTLGIKNTDIPVTVESRSALYRSVLSDRRVLVVLDNVVDAQQVAPLLPASSTCGVIITSRSALSGLAVRRGQRVTLRPLTETSSITLLQNVIGHERTAAESDAVHTLARRCGQLPLALLIAAERVATHPHHSVIELVEELALAAQRLDVLDPDDSIAVRTTFSWSYSDLSADSALMFRMLGLHGGAHITVGAAAALIRQPVSRTRRLLDRLTRVHLVDGMGSDRYTMHDLVQVYAAERVIEEHQESDREEAIRRMLDWYLHNAYAANKAISPQRDDPQLEVPDPDIDVGQFDFTQAVAWCESEISNIVLATQLAVEIGANKLAWQLPVGCFNYLNLRRFNYIHHRKGLSPWVVSHEAGVRGARNANDKFGEAWALNNLAIAYRELGLTDESYNSFQLALTIREEIGDQVGLAWTLAGIGMLEAARNNHSAAVRTLDKAVANFNVIQNVGGTNTTHYIMGDYYRQLRKFDLALAYLQKSLTLSHNSDDRNSMVHALLALGNTYADLRSTDDALQYYERALILQRDIGDHWGEAATLYDCSLMLQEIGATGQAREFLHMALAIFEELDDPRSTDLRAQLDL